MKPKIFSLIFFALICLHSCVDEKKDINIQAINSMWPKNKPALFTFSVNDAENPKNITFVVRNNNSYPYSNIRFFVTQTNVKNKKSTVDTVNFTLAKSNGEWLGKGFGETKEIIFPYKTGYRFPANGKYVFSVKHAMRIDSLSGIEDIGINLETKTP